MKNKKGIAMGMTLLWIVVIAALIGGGFFLFGNIGQTSLDKKLVAGDCQTAPTFSVPAVNAFKKGTSITTVNLARVNGQFVGAVPTNLQKGDKLDLLVGAANFLNNTVATHTVQCGQNTIPVELEASSTNTFRVFNTDGNPVTDNIAGGATNQSSSASPINMQLFIDSTVSESTGDLIIVVEANNDTSVKDIKFSGEGVTAGSRPKLYASNTALSVIETFEVPAVKDGQSKEYTLTFTPETDQTLGGGDLEVYITAYSKQSYVDTDGDFKLGIEDADGNVKYEDTWDFDFSIGNQD